MTWTTFTQPIAARQPDLPWDAVAPGLYPGEIAVQLADGELVALSVDTDVLENGGGVAFKGNARWIEADGATRLTPAGSHVEASLTHTASPLDVEQFGVEPIAREIAGVILGGAPALMRPADPVHQVPARPVIALPADVLASASIVLAIAAARQVRGFQLSL